MEINYQPLRFLFAHQSLQSLVHLLVAGLELNMVVNYLTDQMVDFLHRLELFKQRNGWKNTESVKL